MILDEGYIKFNSDKINSTVPENSTIYDINDVRTELKKLNLIGMYENGIGYGNISKRISCSEFVISGSSTGNETVLTSNEYCIINNYSIIENKVYYNGQIKPSSETLSHAAVYEGNDNANYVIHIHSKDIYRFMMADNKYLKTSEKAKFGSVDLALEIKELVRTNNKTTCIFALGGHDEGVISYSNDIIKAKKEILKIMNKLENV